MDGWNKFNSIAFWMIKLAYINLLWIGFTMIGLVLFGLFPATAAMFTIVHKWMSGEHGIPIFETFWNAFRKDFIKSNGFALIFIGIGYFIYYDLTFLQLNNGKLQFLFPIIILILISYLFTLLFFFPVFVHFELKFFEYIKQSFFIAITSPIALVQMTVSIATLYYIVTLIPGIIPLFTGSVLAVTMTWFSFKSFAKIRRRKGLQ